MRNLKKNLKTRITSCLLAASMIVSLVPNTGLVSAKTDSSKKEETISKAAKEKQRRHEGFKRESSDTREQNMISNEYLEFMVSNDKEQNNNEDICSGRFTIGNVEGNSNYSSDDGQILLFGHEEAPWSSFSTIRIMSSENETEDFKFVADNNEYDKVNKQVISVMDAKGSFESGEKYNFKIMQHLEFITGNRGKDDTVKISYKIENNGILAQRAGIRIMLDTMLADNDDAPFKVVGHGNVISELELRGSDVPASYQVYDNLYNPTTFATGTLYLGNDRKPDKVQFARWGKITDTLYDYKTQGYEFGDSAVAVYFNPINIEPEQSTDVCTYYGVNSNLTSEENVETVDTIQSSEYGVVVYDSLSQEYLSGATITIGDSSEVTNDSGVAIFKNFADKNGKDVTVKVSKDGYKTLEVTRNILCGSFSGVGIVSESNTSQEPSLLSVDMQSGSNIYDLLTTYVHYEEADSGDTPDSSILIRVANSGTANTYRLVQGGSVKYESKDGTFTIPIVTKNAEGNSYDKPRIVGLSAGQDVILEMVNDGIGVKSTKLGLRISAITFKIGDKEGSISIGDKLQIKVPDNIPVLGGMDLDFGIANPLPITIKEENGKFRVALGGDLNDSSDEDAWDKYKKTYNDMLSKVDDISKLQKYVNEHGNQKGISSDSYGAGPLKLECNLSAYGEGIADENGNLNIELGIIVEVSESKDFTHYFFIASLPCFISIGEKGEVAAQIKGNLVYGDGNFSFVGGDCTITPSFRLSLEGGIGIKGAVSGSIEGGVKLSWLHRFNNNYNRVWLSGDIVGKLKLLMFERSITFGEAERVIWDSNDSEPGIRQAKLKGNATDNSFELTQRNSNGVSAYAEGDNLHIEHAYTDVKEVLAGGKRYAFYLADNENRASINRTTIVYHFYDEDEEEWSDPVEIEDDGTADFDFDLVSDGNNIYVVWENMSKEFDENEEISLSDMIESCKVNLCKIDTSDNNKVTKIYEGKDDNIGDFSPSVSITSDNKVKIAWFGNENNYIYGNTEGNTEGKDSIYYAEFDDVTDSAVTENNVNANVQEIKIDKGHVMSLAAGIFDNKDIILYSLDNDGDFNTVDDISLYTSENNTEFGDADRLNTNARFVNIDNDSYAFYYSSGNIAYTSDGIDVKYIFDDKELPSGISDSFSVLTNSDGTKCRILWKDVNYEEGQDIYAVNYVDGKWSKPYILITVAGTNVSIPTGHITEDGVDLLYGYISYDETVEAVREKIDDYTDILLDSIIFEHEDVTPGSDMSLELSLSNIGTEDVSSVKLIVSQEGEVIKEQNIDTELSAGEKGIYEIASAFTVPENLTELTDYKIEVIADSEENLSDNSKQISIGYTDISIEESGRFMSAGNDYIALKISNNSKFAAKDIRIKVLADSMEGAVIYDGYVDSLEPNSVMIYNVNINQLADSRLAYALADCDTPEYYYYNNKELLAINPYLKQQEPEPEPEPEPIVKYNFTISAQSGGKIVTGSNGSYVAGTKINIKAEPESGYHFEGWEAQAGTFLNSNASETTFIMPKQDVTITAKFGSSLANYPVSGGGGGSSTVTTSPTTTPDIKSTTEPTSTVKPTTPTDEPLTTATPIPTPEPSTSSKPTAGGQTSSTAKPSETDKDSDKSDSKNSNKDSKKKIKKGTKIKDSKTKAVYKIKKTGKNGTVEYIKPTVKNPKKVNIPASVKLNGKSYKVVSIGNKAFYNKSSLKEINIGKNVKKIGKQAFCKCSSLVFIEFPLKINKIEEKAFYKCKNLRYISVKTMKLTKESVGKNAFGNGYTSPRVKTPTSKWRMYSQIFTSCGLSGKALFVIDPVKLVI